MMNKLKRGLSLLMVLAMVLSLGAVSALASAPNSDGFEFDLDGYSFSFDEGTGAYPDNAQRFVNTMRNLFDNAAGTAAGSQYFEEKAEAEALTQFRLNWYPNDDIRYETDENQTLELQKKATNATLLFDAARLTFERLNECTDSVTKAALLDIACGIGHGCSHDEYNAAVTYFATLMDYLKLLPDSAKRAWGKIAGAAVYYCRKDPNGYTGFDYIPQIVPHLQQDLLEVPENCYEGFVLLAIGDLYAELYENGSAEDIRDAYETLLGYLPKLSPNAQMALGQMSMEVLMSVGRQPEAKTAILSLVNKILAAMAGQSESVCTALAAYGAGAADSLARQPEAESAVTGLLDGLRFALGVYSKSPQAQQALGKIYNSAAQAIGHQPLIAAKLKSACEKAAAGMAYQTAAGQSAMGTVAVAMMAAIARQPESAIELNNTYDMLAAKCAAASDDYAREGIGEMGAQLMNAMAVVPVLNSTLTSFVTATVDKMHYFAPAARLAIGKTAAQLLSQIANAPDKMGTWLTDFSQVIAPMNSADAGAQAAIGCAMISYLYGKEFNPGQSASVVYDMESKLLSLAARQGEVTGVYAAYTVKALIIDATAQRNSAIQAFLDRLDKTLAGTTGDMREVIGRMAFQVMLNITMGTDPNNTLQYSETAFDTVMQALSQADDTALRAVGYAGCYYIFSQHEGPDKPNYLADEQLAAIYLNYLSAKKPTGIRVEEGKVTFRVKAGMEYLVSNLGRSKIKADWTQYGDMVYKATKDGYHTFTAADIGDGSTLYYRSTLCSNGSTVTDSLELQAKTGSRWYYRPIFRMKLTVSDDVAVDHAIAVNSCENGKITASADKAPSGTVITLTAVPGKGFALDALTVVDSEGNSLDLSRSGSICTFVMPNSDVTVSATFKAVPGGVVFADVPTGHYSYSAVLWAFNKGITTGTDASHFSPDTPTTRAQMVTLLWRAAGCPVVNQAVSFADVDNDAYYMDAVRWAVAEGITTGVDADHFAPNATVTRAQAVTFLWRYDGAKEAAGQSFTDVSTGNYYYNAVYWALNKGITTGIDASHFSPAAPCTRGQIVTFLYRYFA